MSLTIHRMHTRLRTATAVAPHRLAAWQDEFRHQDGERIAARWTGPDEWLLIRRLPVRLRWRDDPADVEVGRAWGDALGRAIARALERDDGNCVRYANRQAALADLVYRAALGDGSRQWAWQRMALIPQAPPRGEQVLRHEEVLRHATAELARTPQLVWPVLMRLVEGEEGTACLTAALRALPLEMWLRLFEASPRTAGFARTLAATRTRAAVVASESPEAVLAWNPAAQALLRWAADRGWFVQRHRDVVVVLLCACQRPAQGLTEASLQRHVAVASRTLDALLPGATPAAAKAPAGANAATPTSPASTPARPVQLQPPTPAQATPAQRRLPELLQPEDWLATRFAGALFWLSRIAAADVLDELEDSDDALPLYLRELALA
ncbi:MAG: hypothetical protein JWQ76_4261, partial [Ramlibacter sp.]|nr:hypothetical protein [Ramlibacter sp.]